MLVDFVESWQIADRLVVRPEEPSAVEEVGAGLAGQPRRQADAALVQLVLDLRF